MKLRAPLKIEFALIALLLTRAGGAPQAGAAKPGAVGAGEPQALSVILISVDTLRADHLSCYGYQHLSTPHIDAVARGGTLFTQADSQVPLTLPSHVSLLTSAYPFATGIEDNVALLGPGAPTLASVLKSHGYRTGAFVGGFVLDRRFGLSRGFDEYDSPFDLHAEAGRDPSEIKRNAEEVAHSAESWLSRQNGGPFFLFLHLYDLHTPYEIPPHKGGATAGPGYDTALAYVDGVIGDFWLFLRQNHLLDKTLVVFVSDHGESLGEHGETTHGYFIYQSTLHVPVIFHWPSGPNPFPARDDEAISLMDVAPTILQFIGLPVPRQFEGRSLLGSLRGGRGDSEEAVYSESLYAHHHFGTASLRSLRLGDYQYIEAPRQELYDLRQDPGEARNLAEAKPMLARSMRGRLLELRSHVSGSDAGPATLSPEAIERLRALGYLSSRSPQAASPDSGPDPKDRIGDYEEYGHALVQASAGDLAQADASMRRLLDRDPGLVDVRLSLGLDEQKLGNHEQAAQDFQQVLQREPLNSLAHFDLAVSQVALKRPDDAVKELQATLALAPYYTRAEELLGTIWLQKQDYDRARDQFHHLLTVDPNDYAARYNLGVLAVIEKDWAEGERQLRAAISIDPAAVETHNALGSMYLQLARLDDAQKEFEIAVRLQPKFAWAHYNLGIVLHQKGQDAEALREFHLSEEADPQFAPARQAAQQLQGHR
jgi:choline-sulfatase